ncbi:hypothetical protein DUNSADRAFT_12434 [Dunaliella salina]|uniref:Protein kinase domain-containing protein n=1 Tax=Dunaliella salina TaxID=3046 RepID=A0ABQ7H3S8_DUNSA|nr:hypothetical protein DUNSADRAFT_12434 [Dunaliella salina]|eukprot:KAF5841506.1 hypothetical protein DUNSADRAFT_12434 [Dunaliella salina]
MGNLEVYHHERFQGVSCTASDQARLKCMQENALLTSFEMHAGERVARTSEEQTPGDKVAKLADFGLVAFVRKESTHKTLPTASMQSTSQQEEQREPHECAQAAMQRMGTSERSSRHEQLSSSLEQLTSSFEQLTSLGRASPKKKGASSEAGISSRLRSSTLNPPKQLSSQTGSFMYMVDVFSFGVMMYELFHRYVMVWAITNAGTEEEAAGYARQISKGYRPPIGEKWPPDFRKLLTSCMAQSAKDRPAMSEVDERLKVMLQQGSLDDVPTSSGPSCCVVS